MSSIETSTLYSDWEAKIRSCAGDVINQALDDPLTCDVMVNPDGASGKNVSVSP